MAKRNGTIIRNINAAAESRAVRTTGKYAVKGIEKTAKWMTTDHIGTSHLASIMELQQNMNYSNASLNLLIRRSGRFNQSHFQSIISWMTDYLHYGWDLLIGFTGPIISMILWSIFRIIVIVACNVIFFYALFWLLFS